MRRTGIAAKILTGAAMLGATPSAHAAEREPLRDTDKVAVCAEALEGLGSQAIGSYVEALPTECEPFSDYFPERYRIISPAVFEHKATEKLKVDRLMMEVYRAGFMFHSSLFWAGP